jgi:serine/threonine protein kinase
LKPANIVLNEKFQLQLTDFGTARKIFSSDASNGSRSGVSDTSYISGLSAVSGLSDNRSQISTGVNSNENLNKDDEELVGSECYISPEMLASRQSSYASDLWAFGVIIF